jgi:hypothetical protein
VYAVDAHTVDARGSQSSDTVPCAIKVWNQLDYLSESSSSSASSVSSRASEVDMLHHIDQLQLPKSCALTPRILHHQPGSFFAMTPVASPFSSYILEVNFCSKHVEELVDLLHHLHHHGILHRDICPSNLSLVQSSDGFNRLMVIDFGCALGPKSNGVAPYSGAFRHASIAVLEHLKSEMRSHPYQYTPADDLASVVYTVCSLLFPSWINPTLSAIDVKGGAQSAEAVRSFWTRAMPPGGIWEQALNAARQTDYSGLKAILRSIFIQK